MRRHVCWCSENGAQILEQEHIRLGACRGAGRAGERCLSRRSLLLHHCGGAQGNHHPMPVVTTTRVEIKPQAFNLHYLSDLTDLNSKC